MERRDAADPRPRFHRVRTGKGEAFVGMLLLGGITSRPEMTNVVIALAGGVPDLTVNNLPGPWWTR